jgi:hypothetical protein
VPSLVAGHRHATLATVLAAAEQGEARRERQGGKRSTCWCSTPRDHVARGGTLLKPGATASVKPTNQCAECVGVPRKARSAGVPHFVPCR